ncbi:fatty acid desaturase [Kordia jejudonensis]|uniref:fatty acid desaturase n=1 Tax=Kordia jejudonensis TaxID=1348245 RepID=UPI0006299668|nr:fatty acid desaturase [Kordia jejudonensis]
MKTKSTTIDGQKVDADVDVRVTMSKLPKFLQWFLTWLTGKAPEEEKPLWRRSNLSHLFTAYIWLMLGISLSILAQTLEYYWLLPVGWLFTVSGARKLITTINHYCVHGDFLPKKVRKRFGWLHKYIADFNSSILFLQDIKSYTNEHLTHHDIKVVASIDDPDMEFMWQLGFKTGMHKGKLWRVLIVNLLYPFSKLHRLFFIARFRITFFNSNWFRAFVQLLTISFLFLVGYYTSVTVVVVAVVFPMTYLYHVASLLQFASEHLWLNDVEGNGQLKKGGNHKNLVSRSKRITNARFCGEALILSDADTIFVKVLKVMYWSIKMLFIHLPIRLFVLSGDLVVHDWHHRCGFDADWANAFYARTLKSLELKNTSHPLTEVWGLANALDLVFESLSNMPKINPSFIKNDPDAVLGM